MRKLLAAAAVAALLPVAAAASPTLALRQGYETSQGSATKGTSMSEVAAADFPTQIEGMWRFGPHFSAGVYYSFAIGAYAAWAPAAPTGDLSTACDTSGVTCTASNTRVGVQAILSFGEYERGEVSGTLGSGSGSIPNKSVHEWFDVGARAKFDF